jgi:hypothetical protein
MARKLKPLFCPGTLRNCVRNKHRKFKPKSRLAIGRLEGHISSSGTAMYFRMPIQIGFNTFEGLSKNLRELFEN